LQAFEWTRIDLPIAQLPPVLHGLRILHLTDTHIDRRWDPAYDQLIGRLRDDPPDLILFTGDFVDDRVDHRRALPMVERFVTSLSARIGIYAVLGNHDGDLLGPRLPGWGVHLIDNRYVRLESSEAALELVGISGVKRRSVDVPLLQNLPARQVGIPRIVLGHYPDQVQFVSTSVQADLMLVGHTHGGQICLPGGRALLTHDYLPKRMARGTHQFGPTLLVVNRGFGWTRLRVRVFCPAQVVELRLVSNS